MLFWQHSTGGFCVKLIVFACIGQNLPPPEKHGTDISAIAVVFLQVWCKSRKKIPTALTHSPNQAGRWMSTLLLLLSERERDSESCILCSNHHHHNSQSRCSLIFHQCNAIMVLWSIPDPLWFIPNVLNPLQGYIIHPVSDTSKSPKVATVPDKQPKGCFSSSSNHFAWGPKVNMLNRSGIKRGTRACK